MSLTNTLVYQYRRWRYRERPQPRIKLRLPWSVPGWTVRIGAAACSGGCLVIAAAGTAFPPALVTVITTAIVVLTLVIPRYQTALTTICLAAVAVLYSPGAPFDPVIGWVVLTGYLGLRLTMAAQLLPWRGRAQLATLLGWRDLVVMGLTLVVAAASGLPAGHLTWTVIIGAIGLLGVVIAYVIGRHTKT